MWNRLDGPNYLSILNNSQNNFHYVYNKPLFAIKYKDHNITQMLNTIRDYAMDLPTDLIRGYENAVRYIISELTYNALEHGFNPQIPSLLQFNWYRDKNQLSFILADLGLHKHLEEFRKHATETVAKRRNRNPRFLATHSFLTALLADPIKILGLKSYKQIKIIGANETIRTIIDFVFDTYTN